MSRMANVIGQLEARRRGIQQELDGLVKAINSLAGLSGDSRAAQNRTTGGRRNMSVAARKRIAAAQRARWAKWKLQHNKAA